MGLLCAVLIFTTSKPWALEPEVIEEPLTPLVAPANGASDGAYDNSTSTSVGGGDPLEREPAAVSGMNARKRVYPGGADEEDLRVQAKLPDAEVKIDARSIQREVFKQLYNRDLKEDRQDDVED